MSICNLVEIAFIAILVIWTWAAFKLWRTEDAQENRES